MASLPPQQSQRNTSPNTQTPFPGETSIQDESAAPSMVSEDSQTVFLDNPSSTHREQSTEAAQSRPPAPARSSTSDVKKCWICMGDSTEDDLAHPPKWRSPCTCNLAAHEVCLLDWVATLENTRPRRRGPPGKFQCPQCKSEIKVDRPKSLVLASVRAWERLVGKLTLPGMALVLGTTVWAGCFYHGLHSVRVVFGEPQASFMLGRARRKWGWLSGYALIPLSLVSARTNYADFVLPGSTVFLLATQLSDPIGVDWGMWPPRSSTVFACLPVVRNCYNYLYEKAFGDLNRHWLREIQPRQLQEGNGLEENEADHIHEREEMEIEDGDVLLELNLEIGMDDNDGEQGDARENQARQPLDQQEIPPQPAAQNAGQPPGEAPIEAPRPNNEPENNAPAQQGQNNPEQPPAILNRRPNELFTHTTSLFHNTVSALLFPSIAAGMGALLQLALPPAWTKPSSYYTILSHNGREQLLRTRWGRSVVGGCLFIVLKDALITYVRWRMARDHRRRKIMDWDRARKSWVLND